MKKLTNILVMLFFSFGAISQNFKYEILDEDNYSFSDNIIPATNGFLHFEIEINKKVMVAWIGLNKIRMGATLNKLDASLKLVKSGKLLNGEKKLLPGQYQFFKFNTHHCLVYQDMIDEGKLGNIRLLVIDEESLGVKTEKTLVDFDEQKLLFDVKKVIRGDRRTYAIYLSQSQKKLLIVSEGDLEKEDSKTIYIHVLDENLKTIIEKKLDFKAFAKNINFYSTIVNDEGNVYIAYREYYGMDKKGYILNEEGKRSNKGNITEDMKKLLIAKPGTDEPLRLTFKLEGNSIDNLGMIYSPLQNKVFILGLFSEGWNENSLGIFHAIIDPAKPTPPILTRTTYTKELVKQFDEDGYAKTSKNKYGLFRHFNPSYFIRGDGSVDYILSYQKTTTMTSTNSKGGTSSSTTSYGGNFLIAHLTNDQFTFTRVPRDISSPNGATVYLSFSPYSIGDKLILLYNDSEKNIEQNVDRNPKNSVVEKSEICATTIDKNGVLLKRELLLKGYKSKTIGILNQLYPVSKNSFLVLLQKLNFMSMSTADTKYAKITVSDN